MLINILTSLRQKLFEKQLPGFLQSKGNIFKINSKEDIIWDLVVVYDCILDSVSIKHKKNGLLFISGEPPMVGVYSKLFLNQFDYIISSHTKIKYPQNYFLQQSLPWYYGYDFANDSINYTFNDLENRDPFIKKAKKISFITTNRNFLPGHILRVKFLEEIQKKYSDYVDIYGIGFHPINDKAEAIDPYCFSICIENSNIDNYWTEKIADAFLGYSVPIYYGCKNISSYFSTDSFIAIDLKDKKATFSQIEKIIQNTKMIYNEKLSALIESRKKCLYEYNVFFSIVSFAEKYIQNSLSDNIINTDLQPSKYDYIATKYMKIKRIMSKMHERYNMRVLNII